MGDTFFIYCRDRRGTQDLRLRLAEAHWAYMDPYEARMVARGPTLTDDGELMTGSLHIINLPDLASARRYVVEEPFRRAGAYERVDLLTWDDALGRTMWDFRSAAAEPIRFLVIGHASGDEPDPRLLDRRRARWRSAPELIAAGFLRSPDEGRWAGFAMLAEVPDESVARRLAEASAPNLDGPPGEVEVHRWRFGGRPSAP